MKFQLIAAAALAAASVSAQAAPANYDLSTVFPGATTVGFEGFDGYVNTTGSVDVGSGVTLSSDVDAELSPANRDLGDNGAWTIFGLNGFAASGTNGVLNFTFNSLKSGVSAFVSHLGGANLLVEALDVNGSLLEVTGVSFAALGGIDSYDEGLYVGFLRNTSDIKSLRITGVGAVVDNLSAVPEPESYALALAGLAIVGAVARRRAR